VSFCVKCGKDIENTMNGLCTECFLDGRKLTSLPHHVDVNVCANCGDIGSGERWVTKDIRDAIADAAADALIAIKEAKIIGIEVSSSEQDPYTHVVAVKAALDIGGYVAEEGSSTIVRLKNTVCKRCSKQLGNYYESILQIRAGSKDASQKILREALTRVENLVDAQSVTNRQIFISRTEEVQGGIDVYLSSISLGKTAAKDLSDAYCAETKEAFKLVGQADDGQNMYRVNYLVRLPDFHVGDVILFEGRHFKLTRMSNSGAKVIDIMNFRERSVKRPDIPSFKVYERSEDMRKAVVVNRGKGEIQVLDPSDYSTVEMSVPDDAEIGDTVRVVEIDDALYYVP
jgi:nonsense-mediated mRNA decay protein 3